MYQLPMIKNGKLDIDYVIIWWNIANKSSPVLKFFLTKCFGHMCLLQA